MKLSKAEKFKLEVILELFLEVFSKDKLAKDLVPFAKRLKKTLSKER